MSEQQPTSRRAEPVLSELELYSEYRNCDRWAIIVGISRYRYQGWNLKYAERDAVELYNLLLTPNGGGFKKECICKLVNEEATTSKITQALRSFLKKPAREDLVLIYFACHGTPDFDRPDNVYLLTHDTNPGDVAGTALPMREIDLALRENLLAQKVIVLADTCHSAAIGGGIGRRSAVDGSTLVNRYLQEVSRAKGGIALLTSAEANEVSFEDRKWGGGHGVFTYYLLQGMRGAGDRDGNGIVTVGELFEYVRDNVKLETNYQQHPSIGTNAYDRNLPVAIIPNSNFSTISIDIPPTVKEVVLKPNHEYRTNLISRILRNRLVRVSSIIVIVSSLLIVFLKHPTAPTTQRITFDVQTPALSSNIKKKSFTLQELTPEITGCRTGDKVRELDRQLFFMIQTLYPDALVSFTDLNVEFNKGSTFPFLQPAAKDALEKAINKRKKKLRINAAYRSVTSQQLLSNYAKDRLCGIVAAKRPGLSNHQTGLAIDIEDHSNWSSFLEAEGWKSDPSDPVHFDFVGSEVFDISHLPIIAFQKLWNQNYPEAKLPENGIYTPETEQRLNQSPIDGFPKGGKVFN